MLLFWFPNSWQGIGHDLFSINILVYCYVWTQFYRIFKHTILKDVLVDLNWPVIVTKMFYFRPYLPFYFLLWLPYLWVMVMLWPLKAVLRCLITNTKILYLCFKSQFLYSVCSFQQQKLIFMTRSQSRDGNIAFKLITWLVLEGLLPFSAWNPPLVLWTTQAVTVSWLETFLLDNSICWLINMSGSLNKNTLYLVLQGVHRENNLNSQRQNKSSTDAHKQNHAQTLFSVNAQMTRF